MSPDSDKRFVDSVLARGLVDPRRVAQLAEEHRRDVEAGRETGSLAERLCDSGVLDRGIAARVLQSVRAEKARERGSTPPSSASAKRVGSYALAEELGRGGMGVVYRALDTRLRRPVALKMILDVSLGDLENRERFEREAQATAKLSHPGIVQVFDVGLHDGKPFLVMELVEGRSLESLLAGEEPLTPRRVAEIVRDVADALQHAHEHGVIHRDVKPQNVLIDREGHPRLVDFGLARDSATNNLTMSGAILGTPAYLAPEQARGESRGQGPAVDVYALGAVLYRALVGRPPFEAPNQNALLLKVALEEPTPPRRIRPQVHPDLETIALRCLAKEATARYPSARAVAEELGRFLAGEAIHARPVGAFERFARRVKRNRFGATVLGLVAVLAVAGTVVGVREAGRREGQAASDGRDRAIVAESESLTALLTETERGLPLLADRFPVERWIAISRVLALAARCAVLETPSAAHARATVAMTRDLARSVLRRVAEVAIGDEEYPLAAECLAVGLSLAPSDAEMKREHARIAAVSSQDRHRKYMRSVWFSVQHFEQGDFEAARASAATAAELNPIGYEPWLKQANVSLATGDVARARREFEEGFARCRGPKALIIAARSLLDKPERAADALALCDRALAIAPDHLRARFTRLQACYRLGRTDDVAAELDHIGTSPLFQDFYDLLTPGEMSIYWITRGYTQGVRGDFDEANRSLTKALESSPEKADIYLMRGLARVKVDPPGAVQDLRAYLEKIGGSDPAGAAKARRALEHLGAAAPR